MDIRVECPKCGYVMSVFEESSIRSNRSLRRAYEHALKNPVLCAGCSRWIQRPKVYKGATDGPATLGGGSAPRAIG